jgi:RHS repeat-associated protein
VAVYNSSGLAYYRHSDWLGSSRFASTPARALYFDGAYAPFGESYAQTGTTDLAFTGMNQDTVSNLIDFPAREYNGIHGRWPSPDPAGISSVHIRNPQTLNRYAFVHNSPLSYRDPTGMDADPVLNQCPDGEDDCVDDPSGGGGGGGAGDDGGGVSSDPGDSGGCVSDSCGDGSSDPNGGDDNPTGSTPSDPIGVGFNNPGNLGDPGDPGDLGDSAVDTNNQCKLSCDIAYAIELTACAFLIEIPPLAVLCALHATADVTECFYLCNLQHN